MASILEPTAFSPTGEFESSELGAIFDKENSIAVPLRPGCAPSVFQLTGYEGIEMVRFPHQLRSVVGEEAWE